MCSEKSPYFVEGVERLKLAHLAMNANVFPAALASSGASQEMVFFTELLCKKKGFDVKKFVYQIPTSLRSKNGQIYKASVIPDALLQFCT